MRNRTVRSRRWAERILAAAVPALLVLLLADPVRGEGFGAGPVLRYQWWNPFFENYMRESGGRRHLLSSFKMKDSALFYGPALSYGFGGGWSLEGTFLFSARNGYRARSQQLSIAPGSFVYERQTARYIDCYDLRAVAVYSTGRFLRLIVGAGSRVYHYSGSSEMLVMYGANLFPLRPGISVLDYRAGVILGAGAKFPLGAGFSAGMEITFLLLPGEHVSRGMLMNRDPFLSCGGTGEVSLEYRLKPANVTLAVGGRYEAFAYTPLPGADASMERFPVRFDQSWGVTTSAIFIF